jgi:hypothetical protein
MKAGIIDAMVLVALFEQIHFEHREGAIFTA